LSQDFKLLKEKCILKNQMWTWTVKFEPNKQFYEGELNLPSKGLIRAAFSCSRPFRLWVDGRLIAVQTLYWRSYQREIKGELIIPASSMTVSWRLEIGDRPEVPLHVGMHCPSRNRQYVMKALLEQYPDVFRAECSVGNFSLNRPLALYFTPRQHIRDGVTWQELEVQSFEAQSVPLSIELRILSQSQKFDIQFVSDVEPYMAEECTKQGDERFGIRRFHVPVANARKPLPQLREQGEDQRVEPYSEEACDIPLLLKSAASDVTFQFPVYESKGRLAPKREYSDIAWPEYAANRERLPVLQVPEDWAFLSYLYDAAWQMLHGLVRYPAADSGLPNAYLGTAMKSFGNELFVWDSALTAMCTKYGYRRFPIYATLDVLYSFQFDGGYIHREHDTRDGQPVWYEPDFGPNPPLMSVAEWSLFETTGDDARIRKVYPALRAQHEWIRRHRRLPDGTYWTTGLANGLDNSPSLGDGYPDLTAQMAHDAEVLALMAELLGLTEDALHYGKEHEEISVCMNENLWCSNQHIYATSLENGGHHQNKVVTAFWPLWAGIVPPDRVQYLVEHLDDERSFNRHHPLPSLAADSPEYEPGGNYWRGSVWTPTVYASLKGFYRAGCRRQAVHYSLTHLRRMYEVYEQTGHLWENYSSESSSPGSLSMPDYSWSALTPIALTLEVVMGLQPNAYERKLTWRPSTTERLGVERYPLGEHDVDVLQTPEAEGMRIHVRTDCSFELVYERGELHGSFHCVKGSQTWLLPWM
jgi:hypothetical protein